MVDLPTYVEGFHNVDRLKKLRYNKFGKTDMVVSHIGLGGCSAGGEYGPVDEAVSVQTIVEAVRNGVNFLDTSPAYGCGRGEEVFAKALKQIPRKAYYICTKVGRYKTTWYEKFDFSAEKTLESIDESLQRLGIDYVDLLLINDLEFAVDTQQIVKETLPALNQIIKRGKARYIGVSGYPLSTLKRVVELTNVHVDVVLSHCRCTLLDTELLNYVPFFQSKGVGIINSSVTAMRLLSSSGPPQWHPASSQLRNICCQAAKLSKSRGVELAGLAAQFSVMSPGVDIHILGCDNIEIFAEIFELVTEPPSDERQKLMQEVQDLLKTVRVRNWEGGEISDYLNALALSSRPSDAVRRYSGNFQIVHGQKSA
ncbi:L-galactose dehydrogenase [Hyalella azteca]|uniref:L-galactose dehydrogenase n=1 Tax=Hyalella azteca TaxID=294128 RepID=A0A8B7NKZ0_HYAAZ|nr:L-galactose dehydrogenase [Hyalella azteca]